MSIEAIGLGFAIFCTVVGGVVWNVRLEGRINSHDTLFTEREKQLNDRWDEVIRRLDRIEQKQDRANGTHQEG